MKGLKMKERIEQKLEERIEMILNKNVENPPTICCKNSQCYNRCISTSASGR